MNTTAEKYAKMVEDTDAAVSFYMEMEGGGFFLTFLAEALMELLEAEELTSVTLLLKKLFEAGVVRCIFFKKCYFDRGFLRFAAEAEERFDFALHSGPGRRRDRQSRWDVTERRSAAPDEGTAGTAPDGLLKKQRKSPCFVLFECSGSQTRSGRRADHGHQPSRPAARLGHFPSVG